MKKFERAGVPGQEASQIEEARRAEAISRYIDLRVVGTNEAVDEDELKEIGDFYEKLSPREKADTLYAKLMAYTLDKQAEAAREAEAKQKSKEYEAEAPDPYLIGEIKTLASDPETRKLFGETYAEARIDAKQLHSSELGGLWKNLDEEIPKKEEAFRRLERDVHLNAIKGEGKISAAKSRMARLAENISTLERRKHDLETLEGLPATVENTDVAANFQYERLKGYKDELDAGFVKLPSRKRIHQESVSALLNHRWPELVGEAGSGKSDQADAVAIELTGYPPTEIECESTTGEIQLIGYDEIDPATGGSYTKYGSLMAAFTGFEDSRQKEPAFKTGRIARFDESGRLGPKAYAIIKKARQKKAGEDFYGKPVLPGAAAIWTTNPVGPRYPDRHAPDPAMRRELAEIPVPYPDMSPQNPELYEFATIALFDRNYHAAVAPQEAAPAYETKEIPEDNRETLADGSIVIAKDELILNMADARHGALWRFTGAIKALQDSFVYGNTETGKYPDTLLRYKEDADGNIEIVETGGEPLTLATSTVTLGELASWMQGFNERREKQDAQFRVDTLTEWLDFKINTYLKQADSADKDKIRAIFKHFHFLEDAHPNFRNAKPLTPKEIGYLSPRVPRPLHVQPPKHPEIQAEAKVERPEPIGKYETREVLLDTGERILIESSADFIGGEGGTINVPMGERFIVDGETFVFAGVVADEKNPHAGELVGKFPGEDLYRTFTPEAVDQGTLVSFHESLGRDLEELEEGVGYLCREEVQGQTSSSQPPVPPKKKKGLSGR
jgi:hypothetical protein